MSEEEQSGGNKRRVYDLPVDLVDRITAFQNEQRLPSEVEAVRKLLDSALKDRDTLEDIIYQAAAHLDAHRDPAEASRVVLAGHPKVAAIYFEEGAIRFDYQDRSRTEQVRIHSPRNIEIFSEPKITYQIKSSKGRGYLFDPNADLPF